MGYRHALLLISVATIAIIAPLATILAQEPESQDLIIRIVNPVEEGRPVERARVRIVGPELNSTSVTNSTGYALFKDIKFGEYEITVIYKDIELVKTNITLPFEEPILNFDLYLYNQTVTLKDLDGDPIDRYDVTIVSDTANFTDTKGTDKEGIARFFRLPGSKEYKDIVGNYSVMIKWDNITILKIPFNIPTDNFTVTAPLLDLNFTTKNIRGEIVKGLKIVLSTRNFTISKDAKDGFAFFERIPSSTVEQVGHYNLSVILSYETIEVNVTLYERQIFLNKSIRLDPLLELGDIEFFVKDEEGRPFKGITILISHNLAQNFTTLITNNEGYAKLENTPLSTIVGNYSFLFTRGDISVGEEVRALTFSKISITKILTTTEFILSIIDFKGFPIDGAIVKLHDLITNDTFVATVKEGTAKFNIFLGPYILEIDYLETNVLSKQVNIENRSLTLKIESVNFPVNVRVIDALGSFLTEAKVKATYDGLAVEVKLEEGYFRVGPIPAPGKVSISVLIEEDIAFKETYAVSGPTEITIMLDSYLKVGGLMVHLGTLAISTAIFVSAMLILLNIVLILKRKTVLSLKVSK